MDEIKEWMKQFTKEEMQHLIDQHPMNKPKDICSCKLCFRVYKIIPYTKWLEINGYADGPMSRSAYKRDCKS